MKRWIWIILALLTIITFGILDCFGIIWHNELFAFQYPVKGLDVSHHQKRIDWAKVQRENDFQFVYMKATEGHDHTDTKFQENWQETKKYGFYTGAYHFFSMRSNGKKQAEHFIKTVPKEANHLPPAIDVEIHLNHPVEKVKTELRSMAKALEDHYQQRPILYVTYDTYNQYIQEDFQEFDIWIRDIVKPPSLNKWLIWQYSNRGRIEGIETYVDINAFQGDFSQFKNHFILHRDK